MSLEQKIKNDMCNEMAELRNTIASLSESLAASESREARLRRALEEIARNTYGLQGLVEDCGSDKEIADYWSGVAIGYQQLARSALDAADSGALSRLAPWVSARKGEE